MTQLGKHLVFHLKYMDEMNRLWDDPEDEGEVPDLTGLNDAERVREMVHTVGTAANIQAADFLEECGRGIEDHFTGIGATLANKRKRFAVLRDWYWWARVHVPPPVPRRGCFSCAVFVTASMEVRIPLGQDVCGVVVPYLWVKGGRKGADAVWTILGGWPHSRSGEGLFDERGMVALACFPIKAQPPESFDVDRDPLIAEVMKTIARIGVEETKAIVNFVASLKESEEG